MKYIIYIYSLIVILLCCFLSNSINFVDSRHWKTDEALSEFDVQPFTHFLFLEGGTINISIRSLPQDRVLYFTVCTEHEWANLFGYKMKKPPCMVFRNETFAEGEEVMDIDSRCMIVSSFSDELSIYRSIDTYGRYYFNLANCMVDMPVNVSMSVSLLNPGKNELSAEMIPAPLMYNVMSVVWMAIAVGWLIVCFIHRRHFGSIHLLLSAYLPLKILICMYNGYIYETAAHGELQVVPTFFYHLFTIAFGIYFQLILLLLATGWGMTQDNLKGDKYNIFALLSGLAVTMVLFELYTDDNISYLFIQLFVLSFKVFLLFYVFVAININSKQLEYRILRYNPSAELQTTLSQAEVVIMIKKYKIFVMLKLILLFWVGLVTLKFFTSLLFYGGVMNTWVELISSEFLDSTLFICIAYNYRPRFEDVFRIIPDRPWEAGGNNNINQNQSVGHINHLNHNNNNNSNENQDQDQSEENESEEDETDERSSLNSRRYTSDEYGIEMQTF